jgi:hypothetical protein
MSEAEAPSDAIRRGLTALLAGLGGRAAGFWRVRVARLEQVAFVAGEGLDPRTAREFAQATRDVPLERADLGIVRACLEGQPAISRVGEMPPESGSGHWLRAFGAGRSVAVPLGAAVISIALSGDWTDEHIITRLRDAGRRWLDPDRGRDPEAV